MQIAIADAKARFADLVRRAESGENIVLTRHGKPVAQLTGAPRAQRLPLFGALKGRIRIADDFDQLPEGFAAGLGGAIDP
ncbi:MAG: prevent-host-death family protein [Rhodobacteraceae bacterium]|nr:MAG: prevent-host-death family protein [Paracoccaceae bacterium]